MPRVREACVAGRINIKPKTQSPAAMQKSSTPCDSRRNFILSDDLPNVESSLCFRVKRCFCLFDSQPLFSPLGSMFLSVVGENSFNRQLTMKHVSNSKSRSYRLLVTRCARVAEIAPCVSVHRGEIRVRTTPQFAREIVGPIPNLTKSFHAGLVPRSPLN